MKKLNILDLFSGIGGFKLGFEEAGYECHSYFSEVDKHAIAVYKHNFKNSTYVGSVTDVRENNYQKSMHHLSEALAKTLVSLESVRGWEAIDQSLSLKQLDSSMSARPRVFIWENVKGTFSSNYGEDFCGNHPSLYQHWGL